MFRFFAVVLVIGAFGGALYFGGGALGAWESPKPEPVALPKQQAKKHSPRKRHARPAASAQPVKRTVPTKPSWLVELNATCRRARRESESMHQPAIPEEIAPTLRKTIVMNRRANRETAALVSRSGNTAAAAQLRSLYAQDEALLQRLLGAAEDGRYQQLQGIARSLIPVARAENNLFARLGAHACTVPPDDLAF